MRAKEAMSYKVQFTGHSDDIISIHKTRHVSYCDAQGDSVHDEDDELSAATNGGNGPDITKIKVSSIGGARVCVVHAIYDGTWSFAVSMLEESRKLPPWEFTVDQPEHEYSTRLTIESEDDDLEVVVLEE